MTAAARRVEGVKPPSDRLYGRSKGHALRPRQRWLLETVLPRLRADPADPWAGLPSGPRWLEVGFGGGEHAEALAAAHPGAALIACEVFENGISSLLSRLSPEHATGDSLPANLRIFDADARTLIRTLPDASLDRLFLMFPDPWPKARHAKRRFVHPSTVPEIARVLRPGGEWRLASDDPTLQAWTRDVLDAQSWFVVPLPAVQRPPGWMPTRYEAKALAAGRSPLYWTLIRR